MVETAHFKCTIKQSTRLSVTAASCAMKHVNVLVIRFNLSEILFYGRFEWYICVRNCKQAEFTLMHLADAFIQSDLHIQAIHFFLFLCVFPGN